MSLVISDVFDGLFAQQIPALITVLKKGQAHAAESGVDEASLLGARLIDDMHPMIWQVQTSLELVMRGAARLCKDEPPTLSLDYDNFADLIVAVEQVLAELKTLDNAKLDQSADTIFEIPVGPEATLSLSGKDYVLKFLLPNLYFHLTTTYALLRMNGVQLGKRDFMGPF